MRHLPVVKTPCAIEGLELEIGLKAEIAWLTVSSSAEFSLSQHFPESLVVQEF
jgi:hypothetical protein